MNSTEKEITLKPQDLKNDDFRNYGLRFSKKEIEYEEKVLLFQVTGIAVLLVFYGCYFIKMTAQSRKGIKTDQTELMTNGIYRFSRNPAFLGFDLVYIGILLMFFHWILLAASVFVGVMLHLQIVYVEEGFLKEVFGEEYLEYQKKVCRYLGRK